MQTRSSVRNTKKKDSKPSSKDSLKGKKKVTSLPQDPSSPSSSSCTSPASSTENNNNNDSPSAANNTTTTTTTANDASTDKSSKALSSSMTLRSSLGSRPRRFWYQAKWDNELFQSFPKQESRSSTAGFDSSDSEDELLSESSDEAPRQRTGKKVLKRAVRKSDSSNDSESESDDSESSNDDSENFTEDSGGVDDEEEEKLRKGKRKLKSKDSQRKSKYSKEGVKSDTEGAEALLGLADSVLLMEDEPRAKQTTTPIASKASRSKKPKSRFPAKEDSDPTLDIRNFLVPPPVFPKMASSATNAASQQPIWKRGALHAAIAYYVFYQQRYDLLQQLSVPNAQYAQKFLLALSLDPTAEAKMLLERAEAARQQLRYKAQESQREPPESAVNNSPTVTSPFALYPQASASNLIQKPVPVNHQPLKHESLQSPKQRQEESTVILESPAQHLHSVPLSRSAPASVNVSHATVDTPSIGSAAPPTALDLGSPQHLVSHARPIPLHLSAPVNYPPHETTPAQLPILPLSDYLSPNITDSQPTHPLQTPTTTLLEFTTTNTPPSTPTCENTSLEDSANLSMGSQGEVRYSEAMDLQALTLDSDIQKEDSLMESVLCETALAPNTTEQTGTLSVTHMELDLPDVREPQIPSRVIKIESAYARDEAVPQTTASTSKESEAKQMRDSRSDLAAADWNSFLLGPTLRKGRLSSFTPSQVMISPFNYLMSHSQEGRQFKFNAQESDGFSRSPYSPEYQSQQRYDYSKPYPQQVYQYNYGYQPFQPHTSKHPQHSPDKDIDTPNIHAKKTGFEAVIPTPFHPSQFPPHGIFHWNLPYAQFTTPQQAELMAQQIQLQHAIHAQPSISQSTSPYQLDPHRPTDAAEAPVDQTLDYIAERYAWAYAPQAFLQKPAHPQQERSQAPAQGQPQQFQPTEGNAPKRTSHKASNSGPGRRSKIHHSDQIEQQRAQLDLQSLQPVEQPAQLTQITQLHQSDSSTQIQPTTSTPPSNTSPHSPQIAHRQSPQASPTLQTTQHQHPQCHTQVQQQLQSQPQAPQKQVPHPQHVSPQLQPQNPPQVLQFSPQQIMQHQHLQQLSRTQQIRPVQAQPPNPPLSASDNTSYIVINDDGDSQAQADKKEAVRSSKTDQQLQLQLQQQQLRMLHQQREQAALLEYQKQMHQQRNPGPTSAEPVHKITIQPTRHAATTHLSSSESAAAYPTSLSRLQQLHYQFKQQQRLQQLYKKPQHTQNPHTSPDPQNQQHSQQNPNPQNQQPQNTPQNPQTQAPHTQQIQQTQPVPQQNQSPQIPLVQQDQQVNATPSTAPSPTTIQSPPVAQPHKPVPPQYYAQYVNNYQQIKNHALNQQMQLLRQQQAQRHAQFQAQRQQHVQLQPGSAPPQILPHTSQQPQQSPHQQPQIQNLQSQPQQSPHQQPQSQPAPQLQSQPHSQQQQNQRAPAQVLVPNQLASNQSSATRQRNYASKQQAPLSVRQYVPLILKAPQQHAPAQPQQQQRNQSPVVPNRFPPSTGSSCAQQTEAPSGQPGQPSGDPNPFSLGDAQQQ